MTIDGTDFISVKGNSGRPRAVQPSALKKEEICSLLKSGPRRKGSRMQGEGDEISRVPTGELWSRGCPYGSKTGIRIHRHEGNRDVRFPSTTSIHGFRIAPLVKIVKLPEALQKRGHPGVLYRRFSKQWFRNKANPVHIELFPFRLDLSGMIPGTLRLLPH